MNNKTPSYLKDKLPPKHRPFLFNVVRKIKCKTNRYMNSFFPRAISSWNLVISHFEVFPSSDSLKIKYFWCTRSCRSSISVSIKSETKSFEKSQKAIITSYFITSDICQCMDHLYYMDLALCSNISVHEKAYS